MLLLFGLRFVSGGVLLVALNSDQDFSLRRGHWYRDIATEMGKGLLDHRQGFVDIEFPVQPNLNVFSPLSRHMVWGPAVSRVVVMVVA